MKKLPEFKIKTIVATGLRTALFTLLFMYAKIPTGTPETDIRTAYDIGALFGALFGPIAGGLIASIRHTPSDSIQYDSTWWSWVIASGTSRFLIGLVYPKLYVEDGEFFGKDMIMFNAYQIVANAIARIVVTPVLDIMIYAEPVNLVSIQGVMATINNAVSASVIGTVLLTLYSKTRSKKGSLSKE